MEERLAFFLGKGLDSMIYVSESQLNQIEYLIGQSIQGNHVLFDVDSVRRIFRNQGHEVDATSESYAVEHHIERMIEQPTLEQKRAYLEGLDSETFDLVVRTYFNIVENNLYENKGITH
jgi:hypothetical protein